VLLYELLTGKTPFDAKSWSRPGWRDATHHPGEGTIAAFDKVQHAGAEEQTTIAKRRQVEAPKLVHQVRGDLDWIVMKCLEKDRTRATGRPTTWPPTLIGT